jgi:uncharacterized protein
VTSYLHRNAEPSVHAALKDTRVVVVSGARQVGKSTLARRLLRSVKDALERSLDNATELAAARADPNRFVHHESLMLIDEVQRAPDLMLAIKSAVDTEPRPGQYLLTGSARLLGLRHLPDALVGRMETIELWPLSQGEIEKRREDFIDRVFDDDAEFAGAGHETRAGYVERVTRGGFPEAVRRDEGRRARFFASYANDLIDRDVRQLAEIQRRDALKRLLIAAAGRSAQLLKTEALASDLRAPASTIERYLTLFEDVFLIKRIPAWSAATTQRAVQMRKLLFVDAGLNAHLIGRSARRLAKDDAALGPLLENFVISELARQIEWAGTRCSLHHFRDRDGVEVDAVIEAADGRVAGFEVKAGETVRTEAAFVTFGDASLIASSSGWSSTRGNGRSLSATV